MYVPVRTALSCAEALNRLEAANNSDEIHWGQGDPREPWFELINRAGHATWVSSYLSKSDTEMLADFFARSPLTLTPRFFARLGDWIELQTPGVQTNIELNSQERYEWSEDLQDYTGACLGESTFIRVAEEGLIDWTVRSTSPTFELRRCLQCNTWFIPARAGRARFCGYRCRNHYNSGKPASDNSKFYVADGETGALIPLNFRCTRCKALKRAADFSGLCTSHGDRPAPTDLEMSGFWSNINSNWCNSCILQYRPQWARYVSMRDIPNDRVKQDASA